VTCGQMLCDLPSWQNILSDPDPLQRDRGIRI